jgi:hypothetical protein
LRFNIARNGNSAGGRPARRVFDFYLGAGKARKSVDDGA